MPLLLHPGKRRIDEVRYVDRKCRKKYSSRSTRKGQPERKEDKIVRITGATGERDVRTHANCAKATSFLPVTRQRDTHHTLCMNTIFSLLHQNMIYQTGTPHTAVCFISISSLSLHCLPSLPCSLILQFYSFIGSIKRGEKGMLPLLVPLLTACQPHTWANFVPFMPVTYCSRSRRCTLTMPGMKGKKSEGKFFPDLNSSGRTSSLHPKTLLTISPFLWQEMLSQLSLHSISLLFPHLFPLPLTMNST